MLSRSGRRCVQGAFNSTRQYSSSHANITTTTKSRTAQATATKPVSEPSKRPQSTVAVASRDRPIPSPAFNRDDSRFGDVQSLIKKQPVQLDHSFVGMKGGEIFHEMMLRHGVKHICNIASHRL
jgi:acetolactate synthase-1/2/3 large subunit